MTSMADVSIEEKIMWLMQWEAECKCRITHLPLDASYEILFKHEGSEVWHEYVLPEQRLRMHTIHHALLPLRTLVKMTKP